MLQEIRQQQKYKKFVIKRKSIGIKALKAIYWSK